VDLTGAGPRLELGDVRVDDPATLILDLPASAGDGAAFDLTGRAPGAGARPASLERWASLEPGEALAVEGLPPGEWTVSRTFGSLGLRGVRVPVATLALAGGDVKHLTIEGCEPSIVHGAVPRGAVPAEHLEVVALRADAPLFYEASLDASGRFAFDTLPAGYPYVLTIRFRGATQDLACADLTDGWSAAVASVVDPERSAESVLVAALPGRQPPVEFRELPLTAPIDIAGLPRGDGVRVEISADTANGRAFGPWTVALGGDVKPTLDLPPGPYLARVFDGERLLGEVRSVARPRERNVWALPR
jgi:hypothetical protein